MLPNWHYLIRIYNIAWILKILPPPCYYHNATLAAMGLSRNYEVSQEKNKCSLSEHGWDLKIISKKKMHCCYSVAIHVHFLYHPCSHRPLRNPLCAQDGAGGTPWGSGAASAESRIHPAKRDRCFPPPIAERQRLPNVGIFYWFLALFLSLCITQVVPIMSLLKSSHSKIFANRFLYSAFLYCHIP